MFKKLLIFIIAIVLILFITIIYLSKFGLETNKANSLIKEQVKKYHRDLELDIKKVKIYLKIEDLFDPEIKIQTDNSIIKSGDDQIKIAGITTYVNLFSYFRDSFTIDNLTIVTSKNEIKDLISIAAKHEKPKLIILNSFIKEGSFWISAKINFDKDGNIKKDSTFTANIIDAKVKLPNNTFKNINFVFEKEKKNYLKNSSFIYKNIKFNSNFIEIEEYKNNFIFKGDLSNGTLNISSKLIKNIFPEELSFIEDQEFQIKTENEFKFKLDKYKIKDLKISSNINLEKLNLNLKSKLISKYIKNYKNLLILNNNKISITYEKDKFNIDGKSNYSLENLKDNISYQIVKNKNEFNFNISADLDKSELIVESLSYQKKKNDPANIKTVGKYQKDKNLKFEKIIFNNGKNYLEIKNLNLTKDYRFKNLDNANLEFINLNKKQNQITIERNKKNYNISGKVFDSNKLIDELLKNQNKSSIFDDFNSKISLNINKAYIDNLYFFKNLKGEVKFLNNEIYTLNISALVNERNFSYKIKNNDQNKKITTIYLDFPEPLVKKYKFIKGFKEGSLDYYSVKENDITKSELKIYNFKLMEMPALAKILTLSSLQGIADIMTGEGIRFEEFDMKFTNKKNIMVIDEIYAIGPAISILMSGYIENENLVSLRGTLVPATTINKSIAKIPVLGDILIGKKTGEGIFGVSFKIKGPPKELKTTVNPIKTLTPRFITRTLEKIKRNN